MATQDRVRRTIAAQLERVGGVLEQAIAADEAWTLGAVERERGEIHATFKTGLGFTSDSVRITLCGVAGTSGSTQVEIELSLGGLSRRAKRERVLEGLLDRVAAEVETTSLS